MGKLPDTIKAQINLANSYLPFIQYAITSCAFSNQEQLNLQHSAPRVAKSFLAMVVPREVVIDRLKNILSKSLPTTGSTDYVIVSPIETSGLCPHHFLPIMYNVLVAVKYRKGSNLIGLSKYPRAVQLLAKRPLVQEQFTRDIASFFCSHKVGDVPIDIDKELKLDIKSCAVIVKGVHGCMQCRGVRTNSSTITTARINVSDAEFSNFLSIFNAQVL